MKDITCEPGWIRDVIQGKTKFRKCPNCDNDAMEIQEYNDEGYPVPPGTDGAHRDECTICEGIGYLEIPE